MTQTQARPDWNAEMDRQIKATESAMELAKDNERVIIEQRKVIDRLITALRKIARMPIGECLSDVDSASCESCCRIDTIARIALEEST